MPRISRALLALVCLSSAASAQSTRPQAIFRTGVDVVRLDVSVLDQDRRPVRGLTADDFTILEDGRPRPIVAFSAIDIPDIEQPVKGWRHDVGSDVSTNQLDTQRIVVIVMDDGITQNGPSTADFGKQIARAVIDRLGPNDLAAVVFTFRGTPQNFTRDRRALLAAVETFIPKASVRPDTMSAAVGGRPNTAFEGTPGGGFDAPLGCTLRGQVNCLTDTLKHVAAALEDAPAGRKTIVLVSSGFPSNLSFDNIDASDEAEDLRRTFRSLQQANVNVYPFDPVGLTPAGIVGARFDFLRSFAEESGGRATVASNVPWNDVPQVFVENSSYYLLGIRPAEDRVGETRPRRVSVSVRRPGVEVRTRTVYFPPQPARPRSAETTPPPSALDKALAAVLPSGTLPLEVTAAPFALPTGREAAVAMAIGLPQPASETGSTRTIAIRASAFDREFRERARHEQTLEVTLRPGDAGTNRLDAVSRLNLRPGRYEVRVAAESSLSAGGTLLELDVPDFSKSRLSVSGLVIGRPRSGAADVLSDLVPLLPTTARTFAADVPMTAFLRLYQGGSGEHRPVRVHSQIVDAADRRVFEETVTFDAARFGAARAADYGLDLPLDRLNDGEYLLSIEATDTKTAVKRAVRFQVARAAAVKAR